MNDTLTDSEKESFYQILLDQLEIRRDQLTDDAHLKEDLGADSLDEIQIVMALEEKFRLTIPDDRAEKAKTVGAIFDLLEEHLRAEKCSSKK
jgi:acyl carrier protein